MIKRVSVTISENLEKISVAGMAVNSADDFLNPLELDIMPKEIKRMPKGKFVLLLISDTTRGHGTHSSPALSSQYLVELLRESQHYLTRVSGHKLRVALLIPILPIGDLFIILKLQS